MVGKIRERVKRILGRQSIYSHFNGKHSARRSDNILMWILWTEDMEILHQGNDYTLQIFFNELIEGKLTNMESAIRVRRQLQAKYPELRNKETYEKRMKRSVEFKQEFSNRYNFEGRE
jgi:hypothetical protein|tara:strand:- start:2532 stop:2885 length:354 start_codon:yes stop_codon:yes gene_type:complete